MRHATSLKEKWSRGEKAFGVWLNTSGSAEAEMVAREGPDYVCVDYQHGLFDHTAALAMFQASTAAGVPALARPAWNEPARIMSALDAGAIGVIVPMVNTRKEAETVVQACRFHPRGARSFGPTRSRDLLEGSNWRALEEVVVAVMIETLDGMANIDAITAVDGIDMLYVGPADLSISLGGEPSDGVSAEVLAQILGAAHGAGKFAGIQATSGEQAGSFAAMGFDMATVGQSSALMRTAVSSSLASARAYKARR